MTTMLFKQTPWPDVLTKRGYKQTGWRTGVDPKRHLLHKYGGAPALDCRACWWWQENGIVKVFCKLTTGEVWWTYLDMFMASAIKVNLGHGDQFVADRKRWSIVK